MELRGRNSYTFAGPCKDVTYVTASDMTQDAVKRRRMLRIHRTVTEDSAHYLLPKRKVKNSPE